MDKTTEENLKNAFAGESQAHMKYNLFAEAAEKEGKPTVARLFRAIAFAEQIHAKNHLKTLAGIQKTSDNLATAMAGETYEVNEMYPAFHKQAQEKGEKSAARSNHWALEAEKVHAKMYEKAKSSVDSGKDTELKPIYVCPVCGYTEEGEQCDVCPLCNVKRSVFIKF